MKTRIVVMLFVALLFSGCRTCYKGMQINTPLIEVPAGVTNVTVTIGDVLFEAGGANVDKLGYIE